MNAPTEVLTPEIVRPPLGTSSTYTPGYEYGTVMASLADPHRAPRVKRSSAARRAADAVLVITGASAVDRYSNWASLLYVTLVGLWVVPGTHADGIFLAAGSVWDVRNEFLYATA